MGIVRRNSSFACGRLPGGHGSSCHCKAMLYDGGLRQAQFCIDPSRVECTIQDHGHFESEAQADLLGGTPIPEQS